MDNIPALLIAEGIYAKIELEHVERELPAWIWWDFVQLIMTFKLQE